MSKSASRARLAEIIRKRSFGRGEITLASGRKSDFYFNLKPTMLDPEGASLLAELTFEALKDDRLDYVGGLEMGAVPLAGAIFPPTPGSASNDTFLSMNFCVISVRRRASVLAW